MSITTKGVLAGMVGAFVLLAIFQLAPALSRNTLGKIPTLKAAA